MYAVHPCPVYTDPNIKVAEGAFPRADLARAYGDDYLNKHGFPGQVGFHEGRRADTNIRACTSVWLPWPHEDGQTRWLYDALGDIAQQANAHFWQYDIWGFQDNLHYVRYAASDGPDGGKFNWHQVRGDDWRRAQRKLACVVMLSDPSEYEGGDVQIFDGREQTLARLAKGSAYVMPSFVQHRVCPVTSGERRVLIGWLCGPRFR